MKKNAIPAGALEGTKLGVADVKAGRVRRWADVRNLRTKGMTTDTQAQAMIVVWDGTLPAKCFICSQTLGPTVGTVVAHAMSTHPGELQAHFDRLDAGNEEA